MSPVSHCVFRATAENWQEYFTLHWSDRTRTAPWAQVCNPEEPGAPLLVGDFKFKIDIKTTDVAIPASIEDNVHIPFQGIPLHSKLISSRMVTEEGENGEKKVFSLSSYGVFRSPWEFLDKALTLEHPLDSPHTVDKSNLKAMVFIRGPH